MYFSCGLSDINPNLRTPPEDFSAVEKAKLSTILNPMMYSIATGQNAVRKEIAKIMEYRDDYSSKARTYRNSIFLLVAEESGRQALFASAQKLQAARDVLYEPEKFGIPIDRKNDVAKYHTEQESNLHDAIRAAFTNIVFMERGGDADKFDIPAGSST